MNNSARLLLLFSGLALLVIAPEASASLLKPVDGDKAVEMLIKPLFGELSGLGGADPLQSVLGIFNAIALIVGGILVAYTLVAGTMSSAHDGEVLGKRWSSLWVPIRITAGAAAIFPINGGYCFLQKVVMWLALMGIGAADKIWTDFVSSDVLGAIPYAAPAQKSKIKLLLQDMLIYNTCIVSKKVSYLEVATINPKVGVAFNSAPPAGSNGSTIDGNNKIVFGKNGECGLIRVPPLDNSTDSGVAGDGSFSSVFNASEIAKSVNPVHRSNLLAANVKMRAFAERIVTADVKDDDPALLKEISASFESTANSWSSEVTAAAKAASEKLKPNSEKFMKKLSEDGFLFAGAWFMEITKGMDALSAAVNNLPTAQNGSTSRETVATEETSWWTKIARAADPDQNTENDMMKAWNLSQVAAHSGDSQTEEYAAASSDEDLTTAVVKFFISGDNVDLFSGAASSAGNAADINPILAARSLGTTMVSTGVGLAVAGTVAGTEVKIVGTGGSNPVLGQALLVLSGPLLLSGAALAYYLPMVPYILWIGAIFGWLVLLVEAIIAAPIWGVSWLSPDADGVVGKGGQGYMLVLSLTLRPPLMVLGLAFAIVLMNPVGAVINASFVSAFFSSKSPGSLIAIVGMLAGCVIYTVFMVSIINRVFSLIHVVPDRILRWIGGGGNNELGQEAGQVEGSSKQAATAGILAAQGVSSSLSNIATTSSQNASQRRASIESGAESSAAQEIGNSQDSDRHTKTDMNQAAADIGQSNDNANDPRYESAFRAAAENRMGAAVDLSVAKAKQAVIKGKSSSASAEDKANVGPAQEFIAQVGSARASGQSNVDIGKSLSGDNSSWQKSLKQASESTERKTDEVNATLTEARKTPPEVGGSPRTDK